MYTRSRVVGTRPRTSSTPRVSSEQCGGPGSLQSQRQGLQRFSQGPALKSPGQAGQQSTEAYTLIAPSENRRQQIQRIAEQELANLEKWKQQNRPKAVHIVPRRLGGNQSESEVRKKQQLQLMQSKYQQKLKREESLRIKKEVEEAELQKMKAIQREKSNKLEEKKRLQENLRREQLRDHHQYKTAEFLSRLDTELPNRRTCQTTFRDLQSSTWNKLLEPKRLQQEEERAKIHQTEHRRVNNAFLDRLQGTSQPGGLGQSGGYCNMNSANSWDI
ncbi:epithelial-stromal interaction protein 1 isoform X2 [Perognathus longimembris pacificus]|uniref:epithelial-stromal interaction protein 1 isoform X2 n=1 Tax=Perognathus longimembris pacificus TaxID=214514 RepID=UPI002019A901|nr:epithelial-stromal interaction protein 1 isoform X2 [Perognathus longimembris pacificus]